MYEGVTEYFAIFFKSIKVNPEEEFYSRMAERLKMQML
jgi:hypothetical protein